MYGTWFLSLSKGSAGIGFFVEASPTGITHGEPEAALRPRFTACVIPTKYFLARTAELARAGYDQKTEMAEVHFISLIVLSVAEGSKVEARGLQELQLI